jgi:hypothetical protein
MKRRVLRNRFLFGTLLVMAGLSVGCRLVFWTGAAAVGTVGLVGYSVYKGGESVVTGVGNLAGGGSEDKSKGAETVVYSGKVFKTECDGSVEVVWQAATRALRQANLQDVAGNYDALSGQLTAQTWENTPVTLTFKNEDQNRTTLRIWIGPNGDLKASESICKLVQAELKKTSSAAGSAAAQKEVVP